MRAPRPGWLVLVLIAFATIAVGATGGALLLRYRDAALAAVAEREAILVRARAHLVGEELASLVQEVGRLSHLAEIDLADGNLEPEKSVLRIARRDTVAFSVAIAILDRSGAVLWAEPQGVRPGTDGDALVGLARGRGRPAVQIAAGEIDVAAPIAGQGAIVAVVSERSAPSLFGDALRRAVGANGEVALVLPGGPAHADVVVAAERAGAGLPPGPWRGGDGQAWVEDARGGRWLDTEAVVGAGPLVLRLVQAANEVEGELSRPFRRLAALVAAAVLLAVGVGGALGVAIRRLERAEVELARSRDLAAMGKTSAAIAHEVKNALNGLSIAIDLLAAGTAPPEARRGVHAQARAEIARLREVADDLTLFAAPPRLALAEVDVGALCRQAGAAVSDLASDCGVGVEVEVPPEPVPVRGDAGKLLGAIVNLARNGVEAMGPGGFGELGAGRPAGPLRLDIAAARDAGRAVVEVRDRGPGIAPEVRARLFQPFVTTKRTGTGLGLAIARRVAEAHGGRLEAAAREGGGTLFRLTLPARGPPGVA